MARNHTVSGSLVAAKMVPATSEVWVRQAWHCHSPRAAAGRAHEPLRPAPGDERGAALLLAAVQLLELGVRQAFLELD
jgi:hypothetical protein